MNREILDKWCERGILGLVLAILVFSPLAMGAVRTIEFLVVQSLTIAVLFLWCVRIWIQPQTRLLWPPISWAVLAFTAYAIGRYLTADIEYVARLELIRVLIYAFLFLAILNNLHRQEHAHWIVLTLVFLAMAISFYAFYQFLTGSNRVWNVVTPYEHRGTGTYISPNHLAGFLEMLLPIGLAWTLVSRARPVLKVFVGYASLVILAGIAVTVSRGSWIAVSLVLLIFFALLLLNRTYRLPSLVLLVFLVAAGFYFIPRTGFFQARIKQLSVDGKFHDSSRSVLWEPAVRLWQENIWWGIGPNHYNYRFRIYRPPTQQLQPDRAHNDYLNTLTDWGIVGTALVASALALLGAGIVKTWRTVRETGGDLGGRKSNKFALVLGASLGLLALLFHSVVDFNMHIPANAIVAITLMALLSGYLRFATDNYWVSIRAAMKAVLSVVLLAGIGYLGWQANRRFTEHQWLHQANQSPNFSDQQRSHLQRAFEAEPANHQTAYMIGEVFRVQSLEGAEGYAPLATNAMSWYDRSMQLNPYDPSSVMRYGMCLDWLDQTEAAGPCFERAVELDPNGYFTAAHMGWHYIQTGNWAAAKVWLERSRRLQWQDNPIADTYLPIVTQRMFETATNTGPALFGL